MPKNNNTEWYTDNDINYLLKHYLGNNENIDILAPVLGTDLQANEDGIIQNNLKEMLQSYQENTSVKKNIVIPVNIHQDHWVLLYILREENKSTIYYFDPLGYEFAQDVKNAIGAIFPEDEFVNLTTRVQNDGYNCGPFIVEAARSLISTGSLIDINIEHARQEHDQLLKNINIPSEFKKQLKESDKVIKTAVETISEQHKSQLKEFEKEYLSEYVKVINEGNNKDTDSNNPDYLLARKLQNEEITKFLTRISFSNRVKESSHKKDSTESSQEGLDTSNPTSSTEITTP
ncbi:MAG: hypothetical protein LEGION0398_MBIBDBAK_00722 [Legionellaceae bacterium]